MTPQQAVIIQQAQRIMQTPGSEYRGLSWELVTYCWDEQACWDRFQPLCLAEWMNRIALLEQYGQAGLCVYAPPVGDTWQDEPEEEYGGRSIHAEGVVALSQWYGEVAG
jgi:hypothetical protein